MPTTRPPAVAGMFYPASAEGLAFAVDGLLAAAHPQRGTARPKALIVPHAGYVFSGPVAASAFATLVPHAATIQRVVVLGPAHRVAVRGLAWPGVSHMATPLGETEVDTAALARVPEVASQPSAHAREHSLEVELPFVQRIAPRAHVLPIVVGDASPDEVARVLRALWGGDETVILISSDLSHYHPYGIARILDEHTAKRIHELDPTPLSGEEACGAAGINGLLEIARERGMRAEILDVRSSGDTAGTSDEVVGYGAFAFYEASHERVALA